MDTTPNEIEIFLTYHKACSEGKEWAVSNCKTMQEVWDTAKPEWLIWLACNRGVLTEKEQHKFACWCVRQVWHLLIDEHSRNAVETKERWIEGEATDEELSAARGAAESAAWSAPRAAAWSAAESAAWSAAWSAARGAAWNAARGAAESAARGAPRAAAWSAAESAARGAQAQYLRDNCKPNFTLND